MRRMLLGLVALIGVIALVVLYRTSHSKPVVSETNTFEQNFINEYGVTDEEVDKALHQDAKNEGFE